MGPRPKNEFWEKSGEADFSKLAHVCTHMLCLLYLAPLVLGPRCASAFFKNRRKRIFPKSKNRPKHDFLLLAFQRKRPYGVFAAISKSGHGNRGRIFRSGPISVTTISLGAAFCPRRFFVRFLPRHILKKCSEAEIGLTVLGRNFVFRPAASGRKTQTVLRRWRRKTQNQERKVAA